jgi:tungstate transport system substrate-binding protein
MAGIMKNRTALVLAALVLITVIGVGVWYVTRPIEKVSIIVSTTTSFYETGFLDVVKKDFETKNPAITVSFISQGTGQAIQTAKDGNADMILVHDPKSETAFLTDGYGINRKIVAYNFFIMVGPVSDPIGIKGLGPIDALKKIAAEGVAGNAVWVSRGDGSGTHSKEKALWILAGLKLDELKAQKAPNGQPWYIEAGTGMTATLQLTDQKNGYTICDIGSYLKNSASGTVKLVKLVDSGKEMINVYSAIACNPAKNTRGKLDQAMTFIRYLAGADGQQLFQTFGVSDYGQALFKPWIALSKSNSDPALVQLVKDYAYIQGSDCPVAYQLNPGDLYK